ncbi:unnamed protein product [Moneuplotes crassus]|uniref:Uncharacterized protein n=1 Tax=Euplotes crassus TaxID=5936 RepID=A0AAD1XQY4_EUPCR|nr:unnamed protein product [Moneuplotes crassus]
MIQGEMTKPSKNMAKKFLISLQNFRKITCRPTKPTEKVKKCEGDFSNLIHPESRLSFDKENKDCIENIDSKVKISRSNSCVSQLSQQSSLSMIGWAYSRSKNGEQGTLSKREAYKMRYKNDRVEIELNEFKKEIESKFKNSKIKHFKFQRKIEDPNPQYGKIKLSNLGVSKTHDFSKSKIYKFINKPVASNDQINDELDHTSSFDSVPQKISKYVKKINKVQENSSKLSKINYFCPNKASIETALKANPLHTNLGYEDKDAYRDSRQNYKSINDKRKYQNIYDPRYATHNRKTHQNTNSRKIKKYIIAQNKKNLSQVIKSSSSILSQLEKNKPPVLLKSNNPFNKPVDDTFISESSACVVRKVNNLCSSKSRSKNKRIDPNSTFSAEAYQENDTVFSDRDSSCRFKSRSKLPNSKSGMRNIHEKFMGRNYNSNSNT